MSTIRFEPSRCDGNFRNRGEWVMNYTSDGVQKPPQHEVVEVKLDDGTVAEASWLKDINKYIRNVNSWKLADSGKYVKDSKVKAWRERGGAD